MRTALEQYDPQIYEFIRQEEARQSGSIRLIPSENYVSRAVMMATSSCLTNKYAEGYPGKRYYEGQQVTDLIEKLAQERARKVFKADHANVQPYSGSVANLAAYAALIQPHDTIMGMSLSHGGHLTHGWKVSMTSKFYNSVPYEVNVETGRLDYDMILDLAKKHRPKIIISGATAYPRMIDFEIFGQIAKGQFGIQGHAAFQGTANDAGAGDADIDRRFGLARPHVGSGHEGIVFRDVGEHDEFGAAEPSLGFGSLGNLQDDVAHLVDGVHVDPRLARGDVDRRTNAHGFG